MAINTFPILYFNISGEMIYIIDQRLTAQKIPKEKCKRVLTDIIVSIFNCKLIDEIFRPHNQITYYLLRLIIEKLVHSSIMRLNEQSMTKLFDLILMVIKYQLYKCSKSSDLLLITDNHFISIIDLLKNFNNHDCGDNDVIDIVNIIRNKFLFHYQNYNLIQLQQIRYNLLNFLKDIRTRVSLFLRRGLQTQDDGQFIISYDNILVECECQIPGVVRYFRGTYSDLVRTEHFDIGGNYIVDESRTKLGLNIYKEENEIKQNNKQDDKKTTKIDNSKEMDLLAKLIYKDDSRRESVVELKFDFLFPDDQKNDQKSINNDNLIQIINTSDNQINEQLSKIIHDLEECSTKDDQVDTTKSSDNHHDDIDLLELMDSLLLNNKVN